MLKKSDMKFFEIKTARDIDAAYDVLTLFHKENKEKAPTRKLYADCTRRAQKFGYKYLGCKVGDEIVAVAGLRLCPDPYGPRLFSIMNNLMVAKKWRNMGIGTAFMGYILKIAKQNKAKYIYLDVNKHNHVAHNMYRFEGYEDYAISMLRAVV